MTGNDDSRRCSAGRPPLVCCVGHPWDNAGIVPQVRQWGEPLPQEVIDTAVKHGLDPHALDWHVDAVHGWEPHDKGYADAVAEVARCLLAGGCHRPAAARAE